MSSIVIEAVPNHGQKEGLIHQARLTPAHKTDRAVVIKEFSLWGMNGPDQI